ncbi:MAG: DUF3786 domain-containing protein [Thermodesulfovibrionales bacterium]|nr:DUF3786 domain-containing protein [Thermodesulfovibrionales bacterium]
MMTGEERAWGILSSLDPLDVCRKAGVSYKNGAYVLSSFGMDFSASPREKILKNISPEGEGLLKKYSYFYKLSVLCYLINAKDIPLSGRLIKPSDIKGGSLFFRGTHALPLDKIAEKYGCDKPAFIEKSRSLNGKLLNYGDASVELLPMPHIPATLILWLSDDEFPARADLLFDSTCEQHLPLDIMWSIAMMTVLVML